MSDNYILIFEKKENYSTDEELKCCHIVIINTRHLKSTVLLHF